MTALATSSPSTTAAPRKAAARKAASGKAAAARKTAAASGKATAPRKTAAARKTAASPKPTPAVQEAATEALESTAEIAARALRLWFGTTMLAAANGGRAMSGSGDLHAPGEALPAEPLIDFAVGLTETVLVAMQRSAAALSPYLDVLAQPAVRVVATANRILEPTLGPRVAAIQERGRRRRLQAETEAAQTAEAMLPAMTGVMLQRLDVGDLLTKIELRELIEATMAAVDVDEVLDLIDVDELLAAMTRRIDLTDVALQYIDMQRVVEAATRDVDVVSVMRAQLEGVDLGELIRTTPTSIAGEALRQTTRLVRRG